MGQERQSERESFRKDILLCQKSEVKKDKPFRPQVRGTGVTELSFNEQCSLTVMRSGLSGGLQELEVLLSVSGLFDEAGDSRDKQRIMMTEERWIDQHNSLFTRKCVDVTFEASINIKNDDMMLGNGLQTELLIELCYNYASH